MSVDNTVVDFVGFLVLLLILAAAVRGVCHWLKFPFPVGLMLAGMGLSQLAAHGPELFRPLGEYHMSPQLILFVILPTLIFESAFHLDDRQLRHNIVPIATLAVPGLLISTVLIGSLIWMFTRIELPAALLLGAILSPIDHVAVVHLFKYIGAPHRLTTLVEGEGLFSDVTLIVLAHTLLAVAFADFASSEAVITGVRDFFIVLLGGVAIGWIFGRLTGYAVGLLGSSRNIELSLLTMLPYVAFLVAEHFLHVSGVMAVAAAGIVMSGWGQSKMTEETREHLHGVWQYFGYIAGVLMFIYMGLHVNIPVLLGSLDILAVVIVGMLLARGVAVFGLVPLAGLLPGSQPVEMRYKIVMFWGGVRGAVAIALTLSLGDIKYADTFMALVTGAVLFTFILPGFTLTWLVKLLRLDRPPLSDRLARLDGVLAAKRCAKERVAELLAGGFFSARIAERLTKRCTDGIEAAQAELEHLRITGMDKNTEAQLIFSRCLVEERALYYEMFGKGHLSESTYRGLAYSIDTQSDWLKNRSQLPVSTLHPREGRMLTRLGEWLLANMLRLPELANRSRSVRTAREYEQIWARHQASARIIERLEEMREEGRASPSVLDEMFSRYKIWHEGASKRLDEIAEQFPEFVNAMQERHAARLLIHAERDAIKERARQGNLPAQVAEDILKRLTDEIRVLHRADISKLRVDPSELLSKVPFFQQLPPEDFARILGLLKQRTVPSGLVIIREGEYSRSLFLIARGVVRVSRMKAGQEQDLATMVVGDFFGEMALLHGEPRTATCRAVTPCALLELTPADFESIRISCPAIDAALQQANNQRMTATREQAVALS